MQMRQITVKITAGAPKIKSQIIKEIMAETSLLQQELQ